MGNFADDKAFEERFHPHYQEIAGLITRPSTASKTDDFKYNTDLGLSLAEMETGDGVMVRFAARVRRSEERNNHRVGTAEPSWGSIKLASGEQVLLAKRNNRLHIGKANGGTKQGSR